MKHLITLPNGRRVTLGVYAKAFRQLAAADPHERIKGFNYGPMYAGEILGEMRMAIHHRINRHIPGYGQGRNFDNFDVIRFARRVNSRAAIHENETCHLPKKLRARLALRLAVGGAAIPT